MTTACSATTSTSIWPAPALMLHLADLWGMSIGEAIAAVSAAATDGEYIILHTEKMTSCG
ncbi:MAG: hypothetical protein J2P19_18230 [Pseudonocardia sp.]|nr:hypothetical protein [Pseudonocardia sp.]